MRDRRILLIDDCEDTGALVREALSSAYDLLQVFTFKDSDDVLNNETFSLILIDVRLPDGNGFDYCQKLLKGSKHKRTPKILLTGESEVSSRVYGLSCGADDYVIKPFAGPELKARIDARLRGVNRDEMPVFEIEGLKLQSEDMKCIDVWNDNIDLNLTPTEFRILHTLAVHAGSTLSREELTRAIWKESHTTVAARGLDSHISRIRKKLPRERLIIRSIYTCGYCLEVLSLDQLAG